MTNLISLTNLFTTIYNDAAQPWQFGFQDSAAPGFTGLVTLHNTIGFYLVVISLAVFWALFTIVYYFESSKNPIAHKYLTHGTVLELIWTITPALILIAIAFPSFRLLYLMDEVISPTLTIKVVGHQWYWSYEYSDFITETGESIDFDSYMIPESDLELGQFRLLDVDNNLMIPTKSMANLGIFQVLTLIKHSQIYLSHYDRSQVLSESSHIKLKELSLALHDISKGKEEYAISESQLGQICKLYHENPDKFHELLASESPEVATHLKMVVEVSIDLTVEAVRKLMELTTHAPEIEKVKIDKWITAIKNSGYYEPVSKNIASSTRISLDTLPMDNCTVSDETLQLISNIADNSFVVYADVVKERALSLYNSQIDNISKTPVEIIKYINGNLKRLGITDFKVEFSENFNSSNPTLLDLVYKNSQSQIENTNNAISLGKNANESISHISDSVNQICDIFSTVIYSIEEYSPEIERLANLIENSGLF